MRLQAANPAAVSLTNTVTLPSLLNDHRLPRADKRPTTWKADADFVLGGPAYAVDVVSEDERRHVMPGQGH